jgi:hypothetical protein
MLGCIKEFPYKKKQRRPPSKKEKRGENLSPGNRNACHSISALPSCTDSIAEMGTQSALKSSRKSWITTGHARGTRKRFRNPERTLYVDIICISKSIWRTDIIDSAS